MESADRDEQYYRAVASRDTRFDGWFVTAVHTTGIYCRPSCPAATPRRRNVSFFATAAAAQQRGFRACKRCRPDASPGSPEWNMRADVVARAMRLIADGVVDREGVHGLATRLGYSERHLNRLITDELGAGPLAIARAQRAQTARLLVETTSMSFADIAFAAGFASVRQFNDTVRDVFAATPSTLRTGHRAGRHRDVTASAGEIGLRLAVRGPFDTPTLFGYLGARSVTGVESCDGDVYTRTVRLAHGCGRVTLQPFSDAHGTAVRCTLRLDDVADLQAAVQRCRRLLDLDADPVAIDAHLAGDELLAPLVAARPGMRSPGAIDGAEVLVRAIVGQQVSVAGARTVLGRIAATVGERSAHGLLFPSAGALAALDPAVLPLPAARGRAVVAACAAVADGRVGLDVGADRAVLEQQLLALPGVGPWTAGYVAMRALGDPDVFLPTDLVLRRALEAHGVAARDVAARAAAFSPWRSYAVHHLWHALAPVTKGSSHAR